MQLGEAQGAIATPTGLTYWNHGKSYLNQQSQGNINSKDTELAKSLSMGPISPLILDDHFFLPLPLLYM